MSESRPTCMAIKEDGSRAPYFVLDADEPYGDPPVFVSYCGGTADFFGVEMFNRWTQKGSRDQTYASFLSLVHKTNDEAKEQWLGIQERWYECYWDGLAPMWSLFTKDGKYIFGCNVQHLFQAAEDYKEAYQFTLLFFLSDLLLKFRGRFVSGGRIWIDVHNAYSAYPDDQTHRYFLEGQFSRPRLYTFSAEQLGIECRETPFRVHCIAGLHSHHSTFSQADPDIGIYEMLEESGEAFDRSMEIGKFPRLRHNGNPVLIACSSVYFIKKCGWLYLGQAERMMGDIFSLVAHDIKIIDPGSN